jgi:hypothetical protein
VELLEEAEKIQEAVDSDMEDSDVENEYELPEYEEDEE